MKKITASLLGLMLVSTASASDIVKVKSVSWDAESMAIDIQGTNGQYIAYLDGTSKQSLDVLEKAAKKKSCVEITPKENSAIKAVAVKCPQKLKPIKQ